MNDSPVETGPPTQSPHAPEAWMRGPVPGVHPLIAPLLFSFQMAREDLVKHTAGLTLQQVWAAPHGFASVGFHLRHIAGSVDRLMTYVSGDQLSPEQLASLKTETQAGATLEALLAAVEAAFQKSELSAKALNPAQLTDSRRVGRKQFPTTVIGLLFHTAEHTQRHVGQAIGAAKLSRQVGEQPLALS